MQALTEAQAEWMDERAAIMEWDGGLSREQANAAALQSLIDMFQATPAVWAHMPAPVAHQEGTEPPSGITLRPYQANAVEAILAVLEDGEHPVANLATGAGKSLVIAALCARLDGRVLVVTHRKKLLEQNSRQLAAYLGITEEIGVYSAGLGQRDTTQRIIFGGVASIYKHMDTLQGAGAFKYIIVDEAHLVAPRSVDSMYATIFRACPAAQRIGLSATPSRMGGPIWGGEDAWFTCCQVTVGIRQLTPEFLAPLSTILTANDIDLSAVRIRAGEFVAAEASQAMSEEAVARRALEEVCLLAQHRQSWAVFCCDIAHAHLVARLLGELGISCGTLVSTQESAANDAALQAFGSGETRALVSCVMMTTGFDIPRIDCIVLLRPTMSKELLIQMIGRGTRLHPGKTDTLLLDYAGNLARHAPLEEIASTTRTPAREVRDEAELARSEEDRQREQERLARHGTSALGGDVFPVSRRSIEAYQKREDPTKHLVRVSYYCPTRPGQKWVSTFLCFQGYHGYPSEQTQAWFERYGYVSEVATAEQGARVAQTFPCPQEVLVQEHRGFVKVIMEFFD